MKNVHSGFMRWPLYLFCITMLFASCGESEKKSQHPNIVYILADDLGYGDVKAFNENGKIKTPNLDQLASEGMKFTDAHTTSAVCTPTRYGILTGRYNWRTRLKERVLWGNSDWGDFRALISKDRTTIGSMLQTKGYHTAFIGKWHLGWNWQLDEEGNIMFDKPIEHGPNTVGFDYSYGHIASLDMPPYVYVENGKSTAIPEDSTEDTGYMTIWRKGLTAPDFVHEEVTPHFFDKANQYVSEQAGKPSPFFLYLPLPSPHTPILPIGEWKGKSGLNPYADFVMMVDHYIGSLLETIEESGVEDNTIVVFTSDNGCSPRARFDELLAKGHDPSYIYRGHKADIYEGGHRVPFIVKWPGKVKAGSVCDETICTTDFMATVAEITGYDLADNEAEDSYSMMPLLEQKEVDKPFREGTVHHSVVGEFAIRKGDWKLIMCPGSGGWSFPRHDNQAAKDTLPDIQLYNLEDDPGETNNLQAEHPEKVRELKSLLSEYILEGRSTPGKPQKNDPIDFEWEQADFAEENHEM